MYKKIWILSILALSACNLDKDIGCVEFIEEVSTFSTDTMSFAIKNYQNHDFKYRQAESDTSILLYDNYNQFIHRLNLSDNSYELVYQLNTDFIESPTGFYFHNEDSVFFTLEMHELVLANRNSEILESWELSTIDTNWEAFYGDAPKFGFSNLNGIPNSILGYNNTTKSIHINFIHYDIWYEDSDRSKVATLLNLNLESGKTINYGEFAQYYFRKDRYTNFLTTIPFAEIKGDSTLLTFPLGKEIFIYDNRNGGLISKLCFTVPDMSLPAPLTEAEFSNFEKRHELLEDAFYGQLHYHKELKVFSRPVYYKNSSLEQNESSNFLLNKPFAVMLFSNKLEPAKLLKPNTDEYATPIFDHYIPTAAGYLLKPKHTTNENQLLYSKMLSF